MPKLKISLENDGIEIKTKTFSVDEPKIRRFLEIFENDLLELRRVELCPAPEAKEYEEENDWPMTDGV